MAPLPARGNTARTAESCTPEGLAGVAERRYRRRVTASHETVSVALADDHAVVRSGLRMLLESEADLAVVAEAGELDEIQGLVDDSRPDVLLLDVHMRGGASLDLIPDLSRATRVLVLTMQDDPEYARTAMRQGARGYVLKEAEDSELLRAVRTVAEGGTYLAPALAGRLLAGENGELTPREREVLALIALGHTNAETAEQLYLSLRTVETHRANIHEKLGTDSRAELVRHAFELGLVKP
jgi:two-component system response regulator NreC